MELKKLSEAYNINDATDTWMTSGDVTVDVNGEIKINLFTTLKNVVEENVNRWGSLSFIKDVNGNVTASYNFEGAYKQDFVDYCEENIAFILKQIEA